MGCLKGESKAKKREARFECDRCGARAKKKDQVCKPVKLAPAKEKSTAKKEDKKGK